MWGGSSLPWEAFLGAAYPHLASRAAILHAKVYTKIFMCAEQRLEGAAPRPGCSGLSLRAWGPQQRLAVSVAELCSEIRASGRRAILAVVSLPP